MRKNEADGGKNLVPSHKIENCMEPKKLVLSHKVDAGISTDIPADISEKEKFIHHFMNEMTYRPNMIAICIASARVQNFNGDIRRCNQWVEKCFGIESYSIRSDYNRVGNMLLMMRETSFWGILIFLDFNKNRALAGFKDKERLTAFLERCPNIVQMPPNKVWEAVVSTLGTARTKKRTSEGFEQPELFNMDSFRYLEADDKHIYEVAARLKAKQAYDVIVGGMLYMDCGLVSWNKHHGPMPLADKRDLLEKMEYLINELRDMPEA